MKLQAVALQMSAPFGEVDANRERLAETVRSLGSEPDLVVTPELVVTGYNLEGFDEGGWELAEPLDGPTVAMLRRLAAHQHLTVVVGILEEGPDGALYDTAVIVGAGGSILPYRKTHLYPPERDRFAAGDRLVSVPTNFGRLGVMICFEHAFPEVATTLALDGAQVIVVPSAVPNGYEHLLRLRSRARAQDNQLFVVASNLSGDGFCGASLIVDPRGTVMAEAGAGDEVIWAELDLERIEEERRKEPALRMRRPELYR